MLKTTGERIRERRTATGLRVEDLAQLIGKSAPTLYYYEKCDYDIIPLNTIDQLAPILKTSVAHLMKMTDDPYPIDGDQTASDYVRLYGSRDPTKVVHNPHAHRFVNKMRLSKKLEANIGRLTARDMQSIFDYVDFLASRHQKEEDK